MTKTETIRILERVCRLYITQARKLTEEQRAAMIETWASEFRYDSFDAVDRAVNAYMKRGKPFMPDVADIMNALNADARRPEARSFGEFDKLFNKLAAVARMLGEQEEHQSIIDPGGFRWDAELQRNVYHHPDLIMSRTSFTQFDFSCLPVEIQEYCGDIDGLRGIWSEIQSGREMARRRFETAMPGIRDLVNERKAEQRKYSEERMREVKA